MNGERNNLIEAIQSSGYKTAMVLTGGGSEAIHALMSHPGASRFVLEIQMPYSPPAMFDYLGESPDSFCSEAAASTMAGRAYERALIFTLPHGDGSPIMGIACTAALQTNRERKGADRAFLCIKTRKREEVRKIDLQSDTRAEQEEFLSSALLDFIAEFLGVAK
jgi:hypothetical protein